MVYFRENPIVRNGLESWMMTGASPILENLRIGKRMEGMENEGTIHGKSRKARLVPLGNLREEKWMVYSGKSRTKMDDLGVPPF